MSRMPLMAGNWKMNLTHLEAIAHVQKLAFSLNDKDFDVVEVAVLPPFTAIRSVQTLVDGDKYRIRYGAQDLSVHDSGAYTGDVSGAMLAKLGCTYVVVGHSERRQHHSEDEGLINAKLKAAFRNKLTPILCVGEDETVRSEERHVEHTTWQLRTALADIPAEDVRQVVVAYEPVWAIGTGATASPDDAQEMAAALRKTLAEMHSGDLAKGVRILYGGSCKADNVVGIMTSPDVDGALVGERAWTPTSSWPSAATSSGSIVTVPTPRTAPDVPWSRVGLYPYRHLYRESRVISMEIVLQIVLIITSLLMVLLVLLHKGKGGGLSDLFGGGVSSSLGGSSVVERNLDRMTIGIGILWLASIVGLGLLLKS